MSAAAGVIHIAMTPVHAATAWQESLGFAAAGWFQLVTAGIVLANRGGKRFYELVAAANALFILVWIYSRTAGLPFGDNANVAESVGAIDTVSVILQVGVVLVAVRLVLAPEKRSIGRLAPAHRHLGLCTSKTSGTVIGDSATTDEDCEARGGSKSDGSKGWMSHAWVVPGCESPWGVFSAGQPLLDSELPESSGKDDGGCAGSGVRDRYGMDEIGVDSRLVLRELPGAIRTMMGTGPSDPHRGEPP